MKYKHKHIHTQSHKHRQTRTKHRQTHTKHRHTHTHIHRLKMNILIVRNDRDADQYLCLNEQDARDLEVAFNLTENGKTWSELGDVLYYFSIGSKDETCIKEIPIYQKKDGTEILNWIIDENKFRCLRTLTESQTRTDDPLF